VGHSSFFTTHGKGQEITNNEIKHSDEEKNISHFVIPTENAVSVPVRTVYKIRKDSKIIKSTGSKLSASGTK
jgi:hypothetical protein